MSERDEGCENDAIKSWLASMDEPGELVPGPILPPEREGQSAYARLIRQLHADNGGLVYEQALKQARLREDARHGSGQGQRNLYEPIDRVDASAINYTAEWRNAMLHARRAREFLGKGR